MRYEKSHTFHNLVLQLLVAAFIFAGLVTLDRSFHPVTSQPQKTLSTVASR